MRGPSVRGAQVGARRRTNSRPPSHLLMLRLGGEGLIVVIEVKHCHAQRLNLFDQT